MEYGRVKNEIKEDHLLQSIVDNNTKFVPGMIPVSRIGIDKKTVSLRQAPGI